MTEGTFAEQAEQFRYELRVHCYRMLGSYDDAEDLVQETFLRAWRKREDFRGEHSEGRSSFRAWLYKIATNACIDDVRRPQRVLPHQLEPSSWPTGEAVARDDLPWLQPFPDVLLDSSVASVNSALQRARPVLREHLPARRTEWAPTGDPSADEQALLAKYMTAWDRADSAGIAALMHEDIRITMPPYPFWFSGRVDAERIWAANLEPGGDTNRGDWRFVVIGVNRQPGLAGYLKVPGDSLYRPFGIDAFRIEDGLIAELTAFEFTDFERLGLPPYLASA
ncbi:sigma-70 family RNA polymerase sigma factor [Streptomyces sp. SID13031]|nr:sigma-70 family RNA polymerase sigma factor [Streptomyces sp. SID13031]